MTPPGLQWPAGVGGARGGAARSILGPIRGCAVPTGAAARAMACAWGKWPMAWGMDLPHWANRLSGGLGKGSPWQRLRGTPLRWEQTVEP